MFWLIDDKENDSDAISEFLEVERIFLNDNWQVLKVQIY